MASYRTVIIRRANMLPTEARWSENSDPVALAREVNDLLVILYKRLEASKDEYTDAGAQFLLPFLKRMEERLMSVMSVEIQDLLLGDFYELSTINQELDRIPDDESNLIIEEIVSICGCAVVHVNEL